MDQEVLELWQRAADTYETEVPYFRLMGERIVAHAELKPGETVLDVACGKGASLLHAGRAVGESGRVLGVDIVEAMVAAAREAVAKAGLKNTEVELMDGEALDVPDASFDVVIMAFGLGFLRPEAALPEMARVLRRPGRFVTSIPAGGGDNWAFFGELCQKYGLAPKGQPGAVRMPTPEEVNAMFTAAGFTLNPPVMDSVSVMFPDEESWWRWAWSHGQRGFLEQLDDAQLEEFKEAAFESLRSFATPEGLPLEQQFMVLTATI